jgi:archaellum component FlaG (FlaF/FlaG flagellin family)
MVMVSVVCAVLVFNAVYPAVIESSQAMVSMKSRVDDRLKSQIEIIHATAQAGSNAFVWVKNIGSLRIAAIENCDVFFGPEGNFSRISYGEGWSHDDVDNVWNPTETLTITITSTISSGTRYFVKVVIPNGVSDDYYFSVE